MFHSASFRCVLVDFTFLISFLLFTELSNCMFLFCFSVFAMPPAHIPPASVLFGYPLLLAVCLFDRPHFLLAYSMFVCLPVSLYVFLCFLLLPHLLWLMAYAVCPHTVSSNSSPSESSVCRLSLQTCHSLLTQAPVHLLSPAQTVQALVSPRQTHLLLTVNPCRQHSTRLRHSLPSQKLSPSPSRPRGPTHSPNRTQTQHLQPSRSPRLLASCHHSRRPPQCPPPLLLHPPRPPPFPHPPLPVHPSQTVPRCGALILLPTLSSRCPSAPWSPCHPSGCTTFTPWRRFLLHLLTTHPNLFPSYRLPLTPPLEAAPSPPQRALQCTLPRTARPGRPPLRHPPAPPSEACLGGRVSIPSRTASWAHHASTAGNSKVLTSLQILYFYDKHRINY